MSCSLVRIDRASTLQITAQIYSKSLCISTRVHGVASRQTIMLFTFTTRRTSNLALDSLLPGVILLSCFDSASNGKWRSKVMLKKDKRKWFWFPSNEYIKSYSKYPKKASLSQLGCCSCKFFSCVRKALGSNLDQNTEQPVWGSWWYFSVSPTNWGVDTSVTPQFLLYPFKVVVHQSSKCSEKFHGKR